MGGTLGNLSDHVLTGAHDTSAKKQSPDLPEDESLLGRVVSQLSLCALERLLIRAHGEDANAGYFAESL
jgi:hypothetical protein